MSKCIKFDTCAEGGKHGHCEQPASAEVVTCPYSKRKLTKADENFEQVIAKQKGVK